jgi:hypothetical protein
VEGGGNGRAGRLRYLVMLIGLFHEQRWKGGSVYSSWKMSCASTKWGLKQCDM